MRWIHTVSVAFAVFLHSGHIALSQAPGRVDGRARGDVDRSTEANDDMPPVRPTAARKAAEFQHRIHAAPPGAADRVMRATNGWRPSASNVKLVSSVAAVEESPRACATDVPEQNPDSTPSLLFPRSAVRSPGNVRLALGEMLANSEAEQGDDWRRQFELPPSLLMPRTDVLRLGYTQPVAGEEAPDDDWSKQLKLQDEKIEILEKMIRLTADQVKQQGPSVEELQTQIATLQSRSRQAADRDQQLAAGLDNVNDHLDAGWRNGPRLPSQLKEWFLPGGTNETPLTIYGSMVQNFKQVNGQAAQFASPVISPYFLLQLNNRFLLESTVDLGSDGTIGISQIQMDYIATDALTVVVGRYLTPFGFFNERLNHEWINKMTDAPLMFNQVSPLLSTNGLQVRGSSYILGSPVKLEYSLYGGNSASLGANPNSPPNQQIDDLMAITGNAGPVNAIGGRLGMWIPALGINFGMSGYSQGAYTPAAGDRFQLYGFDASYHSGNWDARFEFAQNFQQASSYIGNDICRTGMYTQLAYRDHQNANPILASVELVGRVSAARFSGIDPTQIDLTAFDPGNAPVNRNQYTLGINYYLYPSMVMKFDYEWNPAMGGIALNDNTFMSQFVWAF